MKSCTNCTIDVISILCICIIVIVMIGCLSNYSTPSQVNISPFKQLENYPLYNLNELIERFEKIKEVDGIKEFKSNYWVGDVGRKWLCRYVMYNTSDIPISLRVSFQIYDNSENAKNTFDWRKKNLHAEIDKEIVKMSKDIDVLLWNSVMYRNEDTFFSYNDNRHLYTMVRIGNFLIDFRESYYASKTPKNGVLTSKNIELICWVLTE